MCPGVKYYILPKTPSYVYHPTAYENRRHDFDHTEPHYYARIVLPELSTIKNPGKNTHFVKVRRRIKTKYPN